MVDGQHVGSIGDFTCFSFYATKNLTTGEGGILTTDDRDLAERLGAGFVPVRKKGKLPAGTRAHVRFYSDHVTDAPVFEWADEPVAVNPHDRLRRLAKLRGWPVEDWG